MDYTCKDVAKMIDLSLLKPELTEDDIRKGCETALKYDVATVCCAPYQVPMVRELLKGSDVLVSTVIGFPLGYATKETKLFETEQALKEGAIELDMVLNISKLRSGDYDYVQDEIAAVVELTHKHGGIVKVIFENCYLNDEQKKKACQLSEAAGADFVKTSTGFGTGGATFKDLRLMRENVSQEIQVKAAGGIRELDTALLVREVGGSRFGCTRTEEILEDCKKRKA
ncbi:MAG: deoxyribose-phosphate aldolase [Spirochaetota bacterium]